MIYSVLITLVLSAFSNDVWMTSLKNPEVTINVKNSKFLVPGSEQISCEHLSYRYGQLADLHSQLEWASSKSDNPGYVTAVKYYLERFGVNIGYIANSSMAEIMFEIPQYFIQEFDTEAIAVLHSVRFEQFLNEMTEGDWTSIERTEDVVRFTSRLNAFDICQKGYLDIVLLSDCPKDSVATLLCLEQGLCPSKLIANWHGCSRMKNIRFDFSYLSQTLGARSQVIKRGF